MSRNYVPLPEQIRTLAAMGYTIQQIANVLDCKVGTVKSKAHRHSISFGKRGRPRQAGSDSVKWKCKGDLVRRDPFGLVN